MPEGIELWREPKDWTNSDRIEENGNSTTMYTISVLPADDTRNPSTNEDEPLGPQEEHHFTKPDYGTTLAITGITDNMFTGDDYDNALAAGRLQANVTLLNSLRPLTAVRTHSLADDDTTLLCTVLGDWSKIGEAVEKELRTDLDRVFGASGIATESGSDTTVLAITGITDNMFTGDDFLDALAKNNLDAGIALLNRLRPITAIRTFELDENNTLLCTVKTSEYWPRIRDRFLKELRTDLDRVFGDHSHIIEVH